MEEVDINFCKFKNKVKFDQEFDEDDLRNDIQYIFELLEQKIDKNKKSQILQQLYIFSMGEFKYKDLEKLKEKKEAANK